MVNFKQIMQQWRKGEELEILFLLAFSANNHMQGI